MKTKILFILLTLVVSVEAASSSVKIGELYYNLNNDKNEAEVTFKDRFDGVNYGNISNVTIPNTVAANGKSYSVVAVGDYAFVHCNQLSTVVIPEGVKSIGGDAFGYCSSLSAISIPTTVETIGDLAFYDCSSLASVILPAGLKNLSKGLFMKCVF